MKRLILLFIILSLVFTFIGCEKADNNIVSEPENTSVESEFPVTFADSSGKEITIEGKPRRIITLTPSNTEILYELGEGDNIIAVSEYCNYPEDTSEKQKLPTGEQLNIENVIGLNPDIVILARMSAMEDQTNRLIEAGIEVITTEANTLEQTYEVIKMLGRVTGKDEEAQALVDRMKKGFSDIREKVKDKSQVSIYVEVSPLEYGLWSCGRNTFIQELIDIIGAKNIFEDIDGWSAVSEEQVISRNPDVILTTASTLTGIEDPVGEIMGRANWKNINAVKENKVLMLDMDMATRPGPRLLDCAEELVKAIYE
ncbi:MAG: ABC transporter substrate-binding protein [Clostridiaceae bacterium]|nr:ABC transporter substrate-binding protein [Clostridiaceae bacterium]